MDQEMFGKLLTASLKKYHFENYGSKLFYLELKDSVLILQQRVYNGGAEIYLSIIIKECHPEIGKITKNVLKDPLLIDTYTSAKLYYRTPDGYHWNFFDVNAEEFEKIIAEFYDENIKPFEADYLNGIKHYNELLQDKILLGQPIRLFRDSAEKINHPELASRRGHEWFLSDYYYLVFKCNIDARFVNPNTETYIVDHVIHKAPDDLKGRDLHTWYNERCKEIFISKKMWRHFGYGIIFPFIDGKPLKFWGTDIQNGKAVQIFINEESGEVYHCVITDKSDPDDIKYDICKAKW